MTRSIIAVLFAFLLASSHVVAEEGMSGSEAWLPDLITDTPEAGFALAVKLSRMGVKTTQPDIRTYLNILREPRYWPKCVAARRAAQHSSRCATGKRRNAAAGHFGRNPSGPGALGPRPCCSSLV